MPGFGHGPFGADPFGEWSWEEEILWQDIPERRRNRDTRQGESFMRNFITAIQPSFKGLREHIADFFSLRDPWTCRTRYNTPEDSLDIELVDIEDHNADAVSPDERWMSLYIKGEPLEEASRGWIIESQGVSFQRWVVERVYKLDSSPTVTNVDNWRVVIKGTENPPEVGVTYSFHPQEQLPTLAADYGVEIDQYFDEPRQRSQVIHHDQRRMWRGTQIGYENIAKLYGFSITLLHLWRVRCGFETTVASWGHDVWEIPLGSGKYYTGYGPPLIPLFDEIAADVIPTDVFCDRPEFTSVFPIGPYPISSMTAFSTPYAGWEVIVAAPSTAFAEVGWTDHWHTRVSDGAGGFYKYFLESLPQYLGAGAWRLMFSGAGTAPSVTLPLYYECPTWLDCCFCGTHKISVELTLGGDLTDRERLYVFDRVVDELYDVKPVHVEFARFALVTSLSASTALKALLRKGVASKLVAGTGYLYDLVEADAVSTDAYGLTATLTK